MRECIKTRPDPFKDMVFMLGEVANVAEYWVKVEHMVAYHAQSNGSHSVVHSIQGLTCTRYVYSIDSDGNRHIQDIMKNVGYKSPWRPDNRILINNDEMWPSEPGCPSIPQELQLDIQKGDYVEWFFYSMPTHTWRNNVETNIPSTLINFIKERRLVHTHTPKLPDAEGIIGAEYATPTPKTVFIAKPALLKTCPLCNCPGEDLSFSFKCTNKACKNSR